MLKEIVHKTSKRRLMAMETSSISKSRDSMRTAPRKKVKSRARVESRAAAAAWKAATILTKTVANPRRPHP